LRVPNPWLIIREYCTIPRRSQHSQHRLLLNREVRAASTVCCSAAEGGFEKGTCWSRFILDTISLEIPNNIAPIRQQSAYAKSIGLLEVGGVEALGEPAVDRRRQIESLSLFALQWTRGGRRHESHAAQATSPCWARAPRRNAHCDGSSGSGRAPFPGYAASLSPPCWGHGRTPAAALTPETVQGGWHALD
jgi:hypothetical protein